MNYSLLRSRTFWTMVAMFVVAGGNAIVPMISPGVQSIVELFLTVLASYFHLSTAVKAGATN